MDYKKLETLDEAKALMDCVYSVYGLTFHRDHVYHPERFLEMNRRGEITSFIAKDGTKVVGHMAWIRPFFETKVDGEPMVYERLGEVGLSIVRSDYRGKKVQAALGMAMYRWTHSWKALGAYMKCVTIHTYSQRGALKMGAHPTAMFLGGVPKWVVYDDAPTERTEPMSTGLFYLRLYPKEETKPIYLPRGYRWLRATVAATRLPREEGTDDRPAQGETRLTYTFSPSKHLATVHVLEPGADLLDRIEHLNRWFLEGHVKHVTYYMPADRPDVALADDDLRTFGLFPGGWIPNFYQGGRDALVYQSLAYEDLDIAQIQTKGEEMANLKAGVTAAWRDTKKVATRTTPIRLTGL